MSSDMPKINRVLIAGTGSGCGKTTVTCAVLQALKNRGLDIGAAKCGPDYIDPMFHRTVIGAASSNLDPFFLDENTLRFLLAKNGAGRDLTVIEGVMGYYDGLSLTTSRAGAYEVARITDTPVILTVNAKGASLSILAQIKGFLDFVPQSFIRGVILNNCTEKVYTALAPLIETPSASSPSALCQTCRNVRSAAVISVWSRRPRSLISKRRCRLWPRRLKKASISTALSL